MANIKIPFDGFYSSLGASDIDRAIEEYCSDDNGDLIEEQHDKMIESFDYKKAFKLYAKLYTDKLNDSLTENTPLTTLGLKFKALISPREYNFCTDTITAKIKRKSLEQLYNFILDDYALELAAYCDQVFSSRPGFISFYASEYTEWGNLDKWDANQRGALLAVLVDTYLDTDYVLWLVDDCNGELSAIIDACAVHL